MYDTAGYIDISSVYGCDVYANELEKLSSKTTMYEDIIFIFVVRRQDNFLMLWNSNKDTAKTLLRLKAHI